MAFGSGVPVGEGFALTVFVHVGVGDGVVPGVADSPGVTVGMVDVAVGSGVGRTTSIETE